jgi:hypothetical protein
VRGAFAKLKKFGQKIGKFGQTGESEKNYDVKKNLFGVVVKGPNFLHRFFTRDSKNMVTRIFFRATLLLTPPSKKSTTL